MSSFRRLPPIHALAAFEAAARLGTFARAAEELCITQSAVSHRIRQLEKQLGIALFERVHMQVTLTREGEAYLGDVREAMRRLDLASRSVGHDAHRRLRVTATPAFAACVLVPHLASFLAAQPGLRVEIDASTRNGDLASDEFDVALRFGRAPWPGCEATLLLEERMVALASPAYAARIGQTRTLRALERAALLEGPPCDWETWLRELGHPPPPRHGVRPRFTDNWAAVDAATHDLGVVLTNRLASSAARRERRLVRFVDAEVDMKQHYYGVWRPDSPRRETILSFLDWAKGIARRVSEDEAAGTQAHGAMAKGVTTPMRGAARAGA